jgi:hypothetical protein
MTQAHRARLGQWVVKHGVSLGGLGPDERGLLFALVWAGLPAGPQTERQVNAVLRAQLESAASCLSTDHVELRRWLVDAGWLHRDGFCREYRRASLEQIRDDVQRAAAADLQALDAGAWVEQQRAAHAAQRQARRMAWQGAQGQPMQSAGGAA